MNLKDYPIDTATWRSGTWVRYWDADVYVRLSRRMIDGERKVLFDLGSVSRGARYENVTYSDKHHSTGFMRDLMNVIESKAREVAEGVYIESVINEFLPAWFGRNGYYRVEGVFPACYYRLN